MPKKQHILEIDRKEWETITRDASGIRRLAKSDDKMEPILTILFNKFIGDDVDRDIAGVFLSIRHRLLDLDCLKKDVADAILTEASGPMPNAIQPKTKSQQKI